MLNNLIQLENVSPTEMERLQYLTTADTDSHGSKFDPRSRHP